MILFVVGSALREVCGDQAALGLTFIRTARTAPIYRLYEVQGKFAALVEVETGGISVAGELCSVTEEHAKELLKSEPDGVKSMPVKLSDGTTALGPVSTIGGLPVGSSDVSRYGSFSAFIRERKRQQDN